jgi:crossover junction endodeoxyribonuclease RusA
MILLQVLGVPAPQGSKSAMMIGGHARVIEGTSDIGRAKFRSWRHGVKTAATDWLALNPQAPLNEPLYLHITFRLSLPASDAYRSRHWVKPDLSKLLRSTEDALVDAGLIRDDSLVCEAHINKRYCHGGDSPGATIRVVPLGALETMDRETLKESAQADRRRARMGQ